MNLQQLIYFEKVAEYEHYTKAAKELHITQPALSYSVSELEKELGVPLFYKKGRNIRLTAYGETFLPYVQRALTEIQNGKDKIADKINPNRGEISIAYISSMNSKYMPFLMKKFYEDPSHAEISFTMTEKPTRLFIEGLKSQKYNVGFGSCIDDDELDFFPIYQENMVLIAGKNHPLANRTEITLPETEGYEFIEYNQNCGIRACVDELFEKAGVKRKIKGEFQDNIMIVGMVANGVGISVVPQMYGDEYYNVRAIEIQGVPTRRDLYMMWKKNTIISPLVNQFINFVKSLKGERIE